MLFPRDDNPCFQPNVETGSCFVCRLMMHSGCCCQVWLLLDHTQDSGAAVINPMFLSNEAMPLGFCAALQLEKVDRAEVTSTAYRGSGWK